MEPQQNDGDRGAGAGLTIVVPAYNEARRLPRTLPRVIEYAKSLGEPAEVIVVDDGSTDGTGDVAAAAVGPGDPAVVLRSQPNRGKGAAVRRGVLAARFDHVLFTDVDLATPLEEAVKLRAALARGADVAIGSRRLAQSDVQVRQPWLRELAGRTCPSCYCRASPTVSAASSSSGGPRRASSSAASASTGSASTPRCSGSRAGWDTGWPRSRSCGATASVARCGSCGTPAACSSTWAASG
jgi:hypothetical protein